MPKFGIPGLLDALIPKIYLIRYIFLFLTSYNPCNSHVPFRLGTITKIYVGIRLLRQRCIYNRYSDIYNI